MKNLKKVTLTVAVVALFSICAHAVPGMVQYIPDTSGEYVYYSDKSFKRTSILGFLYYDDGTYAVRYYAPADTKNKLLEKDITLYFSINPNASNLELTGENIVGAASEEDTDIINYMHDMFYEFAARSSKAFLDGNEKIESRQDFPQFGGKVTIVFNTQVPIFNIESIKTGDGKNVISTITTGLLVSSSDKSFTKYKGTDVAPKDNKRKFQKKSGAKEKTVTFENQSIKLTDQWIQDQEIKNLWLMDDYAILTLNVIQCPDALKGNEQLFEDYLARMAVESTTDSYAMWTQKSVGRTKSRTAVMNVYYQPENGDVTRDFKVFTKRKDGTYAYLVLTVFDGIYQSNRNYFDNILKSYTVN